MKRAIEQCARERGESEAVIIREALKAYLHGHKKPDNHPAKPFRDSIEP